MATATAMVQPAPPVGPPPQACSRPINRPPPPPGVKPPPPPVPPPKQENGNNAGEKRNAMPQEPTARKFPRLDYNRTVVGSHDVITTRKLHKPVVLRDVTVFQKKQQVGQGTYGYVLR